MGLSLFSSGVVAAALVVSILGLTDAYNGGGRQAHVCYNGVICFLGGIILKGMLVFDRFGVISFGIFFTITIITAL